MHGLYLLWWVQEKHVPTAVVAALLAAGDFAITALEIPTGWLADRYGHRASLIAGSAAQVGGMLLCWLGEGVPGLLAAILLVAVGDTLRSGADQALLYRSCVALNREADFQSIEARSRASQLAVLVVLVLTGGLIVKLWGFAAGWMAEAALSAVGLAIAIAMAEPPARLKPRALYDQDDQPLPVTEREVLAERKVSRAVSLLRLIAPAALLACASSATSFIAQTGGESDPGRMTLFVAMLTLAEACGAALAARLPATVRSQLILLGLGSVLLSAAAVAPATFVPVVVALSLLAGVATPLRAAAIQRLAADSARARAASLANACDRALVTIGLLAAGTWPRRNSRR